ncbi:MAG TPA: cytochrome c [Terriglobales bacterium]|jgi:mono/diheme cytochrome c family protein
MKASRLAILVLAIAVALFIVVPNLSWAQGADVYKAKCAMCHGADGAGKIGPALKGTKLTEDQIVTFLTKGDEAKKAPHKKAINGLTEEQAKHVAKAVKDLK